LFSLKDATPIEKDATPIEKDATPIVAQCSKNGEEKHVPQIL